MAKEAVPVAFVSITIRPAATVPRSYPLVLAGALLAVTDAS